MAAQPGQLIETLGASDGAALPYRLFRADEPRGALVYLHGIQSHGGWYLETAAELASRGYSIYLTDRRGSGVSREPRGYFRNRAQLVGDVRDFVGLAEREHEGLPVFLIGGCWGARTAVTFALEEPERVAGLALISPALVAKVDLTPREKAKVVAGLALPHSTVRIPLEPELFTRDPHWLAFIRDDPLALREVRTSFFRKQRLWDRWLLKQRGLRLPLLLLQSGRDEIVDVEAVREWFDGLESQQKRFVLYPEFDHLLDFESGRQRYWDDLVAWLDELTAARESPAEERVQA